MAKTLNGLGVFNPVQSSVLKTFPTIFWALTGGRLVGLSQANSCGSRRWLLAWLRRHLPGCLHQLKSHPFSWPALSTTSSMKPSLFFLSGDALPAALCFPAALPDYLGSSCPYLALCHMPPLLPSCVAQRAPCCGNATLVLSPAGPSPGTDMQSGHGNPWILCLAEALWLCRKI